MTTQSVYLMEINLFVVSYCHSYKSIIHSIINNLSCFCFLTRETLLLHVHNNNGNKPSTHYIHITYTLHTYTSHVYSFKCILTKLTQAMHALTLHTIYYMYTHMRTYTHNILHVHTHAHIYTHTVSLTHTCTTQTNVHTHTHTHTHTHSHTHTHTHTHTHRANPSKAQY